MHHGPIMCEHIQYSVEFNMLTHWPLVMPYGIIELGQHCLMLHISGAFWHSPQGNFIWSAYETNSSNEFEYCTLKIINTYHRGQWLPGDMPHFITLKLRCMRHNDDITLYMCCIYILWLTKNISWIWLVTHIPTHLSTNLLLFSTSSLRIIMATRACFISEGLKLWGLSKDGTGLCCPSPSVRNVELKYEKQSIGCYNHKLNEETIASDSHLKQGNKCMLYPILPKAKHAKRKW